MKRTTWDWVKHDHPCPRCGHSKYLIMEDYKDMRVCHCLHCHNVFTKLKNGGRPDGS